MTEPAEVTVFRPQAPDVPTVPAPITPMQLLMIATERGADVGQLERLMDLQLRWEANEARKAFITAKAAFYKEAPEIDKNKHVKHNDFWHATLDHIVELVAPVLAKHGLTHSWETSQDDKGVQVACILVHEKGHSERVSLRAAADMSGSKNAVQGIGSTITYLERYTFLAVTGLATRQQDDDGAKAGNFITPEQGIEIEQMIHAMAKDLPGDFSVNCGKVESRFLGAIKAQTVAMIPAGKFEEAKKLLARPTKKKDAAP